MSCDPDHVPLQDVIVGGELVCSLEEAALHVARQEEPHLETRPWLQRLDRIAELAGPMLSQHADAAETVGVLNDVLFRDLGFRGNQDDYYAPQNSFLHQVLERRSGIPITLSVVYMAVARRVGLVVEGTAFPGHFLLRVPRHEEWPIVVDAFHRGRILAEDDCRALCAQMQLPWGRTLLNSVTPQYILRRMLNNLKLVYFKGRDWERLRKTTLQILVVTPEDHDEHLTLGVALAGLERAAAAIAELERYLALRPEAVNRSEVQRMISDIRARQLGSTKNRRATEGS